MPDVIAIVSRKVFDKQVGAVDVGDLWATTEYVSKNRGLQSLADGGLLFLVTVRPNSVLWLVAILDNPTFAEDRWKAKANKVVIRDISELIADVIFANGKRLTRGPKLGMSLQTPRAISPETSALLLGGQKPAAKKSAAKKTPAKKTPAKKTPAKKTAAKKSLPVCAVAPPRPAAVPEAAAWDDVTDNWEFGDHDDQGQRQGEWRFWREDGSLLGECPYVVGEPHGVNVRYHLDGSVASEGQWRSGSLYDCSYYRPKHDPKTDEQGSPDWPSIVVRVDYLSKDGRTNYNVRYFDENGAERDRAGNKKPKIPKGVPETARYFSDEDFAAMGGSVGGWVDGRVERGRSNKVGLWTWWSLKGKLLRNERYDERGKQQAVFNVDEQDPIEQRIDAFLESEHEHSPRYELALVWDGHVHAQVMKRLADYPSSRTTGYLALLAEGVDEYRRIWTSKTQYPRLIVEVVDHWMARATKEADVEAWFIYAAGVRAALILHDRRRVGRWWKKVQSITLPKKDRPTHFPFNRMSSQLAERGDLRGKIERFLDGTVSKQLKDIKALIKKGKATELTDEQLSLLATAEVGRRAGVRLRDKQTGEAWLFNHMEGTFYFNGSKFVPSDIEIDARSNDDVQFVMAATSCDERVVRWSGKYSWNVMQRYGRRVFWHAAKYYTSRGQAEVTNICWFTAADVNGAKRVIELIGASLPKSARNIDPFMDKKVGVIVRSYDTAGLSTLGVYDNKWITKGQRVIETFKDHRAAVAAFERMELEHMRNGAVITRFSAIGKPELD